MASHIERASVDPAGNQGNAPSSGGAISADGRFVAFWSLASNLVPGDTIGRDVFVHDRQTGLTERVSVDSAGNQGTGFSLAPAISADGRYVAFESFASNLVPGDTNGEPDIFVHDRLTGLTERVSVGSAGTQGDGSSLAPAISADGRYVAFESFASNLVPGDTNGEPDIFVHDRLTGLTERVSVDSAGIQGNGSSLNPAISADGRFVAFQSTASNLVPGDTNAVTDVFVHDRQTGRTERVSVDSVGGQAEVAFPFEGGIAASISADGRFVAFLSDAPNLVPGFANSWPQAFVHDRQTGLTQRISVDSAGNPANLSAVPAAISADGRFVTFASAATNLVPGDTNDASDVFLVDRTLVPEPPPLSFTPVEKQAIDPAIYAAHAGGRSFGWVSFSPFGTSIDVSVTFESEIARYQSVLGYYPIGVTRPFFGDARILFPQIEQAEADPAYPEERPGGGPLAAGTTFTLPPGSQYGLFLIAQGAALNDPRLFDPDEGTLIFDAGGAPASASSITPRLFFIDADTGEKTEILGDIFHVLGGSAVEPNPLNPDGALQVVSFRSVTEPGVSETRIYFEDKRLADPSGDRDFNDLVIRVQEVEVSGDRSARTVPAGAPEPEPIRIEPGAGKTRLAAPVAGEQVLDLGAFGLDFRALDSNGDGAVGRGDAFVKAREHRLRIDLGAASGEAPGIDVLIVKGTAELAAEAFA